MKKIISVPALVHISREPICNERFNADLSTEFYHAAAHTNSLRNINDLTIVPLLVLFSVSPNVTN